MISQRFIEGRHSVWSFGSKCRRRSRPSAREGLLNLVLVMMSGGWKGNLSRNRISKLNVSFVFCSTDSAVLEISSYFVNTYQQKNESDIFYGPSGKVHIQYQPVQMHILTIVERNDLHRLRDREPFFSGLVCIDWGGCARAEAPSRCVRASERRFRQTRPNLSEWFTRPY